MGSKNIAPSCSEKKSYVVSEKPSATKERRIIAETLSALVQDFVISSDEIGKNCIRGTTTIIKRSVFELSHSLYVKIRLSREIKRDTYAIAVAVGIRYNIQPKPIFAAFTFTALNKDGYLNNLEFSTGGTFLFTEENSFFGFEFGDISEDEPDLISATPYLLFPGTVRIAESISLKLHVEIYPQFVEDQEYLAQLRTFGISNSRYKLGFQSFLPSDAFSDFAIRIGNNLILCHRDILSCRSSYFAEIFRPRAQRKLFKDEYDSIDVTADFDIGIIRMIVDFIYTSEIAVLTSDSALKLSKAAHKFGVRDLKCICDDYLKTEMDRSSFPAAIFFKATDPVRNSTKLKDFAKCLKPRRDGLESQREMDYTDLIITEVMPGEKSEGFVTDFVRLHWPRLDSEFYDAMIKERPSELKDIMVAVAAARLSKNIGH